MRFFAARRTRNATIAVVALAFIALCVVAVHNRLGNPAFLSGYLLLAAVLLLACYNLRKKLPQLPFASSTTWLQVHIYVGLATLVVFALHIGPSWPHGLIDRALAIVYFATFTSGVFGLYLTRTIPAQLARVGEEVIYERIPRFRRELRDRAHQAALEAVTTSGQTTVADFYSAQLYDFFERPRGWWYVLRPTTRRRRSLLAEMQDLRRYLSAGEKDLLEKLFSLVRKKDDLDFHAARQGLLKGWLFVHIALTYALLLLAAVHGVAAHAYWGGAL